LFYDILFQNNEFDGNNRKRQVIDGMFQALIEKIWINKNRIIALGLLLYMSIIASCDVAVIVNNYRDYKKAGRFGRYRRLVVRGLCHRIGMRNRKNASDGDPLESLNLM
jgi:hypothetical protein